MSTLPAHAPVVVIGGGIMGCSTLYHLAQMGVTDAILIERNQLTSGTTWHSAAQVRALRHSRNLTRLIQYSVDLYSRLEAETGQSVGWIQKGSLSLATSPERLTHIRRQADLARAWGIPATEISAAEALERWPLMNADDVLGAVWSPEDGRVSPSDVCAALVKGAKARGAQLFENTAVTGLTTEGGRVTAVETSAGTVRCDAVALCAGLWSRELAAMADERAPALACEHFYLLTKPIAGISGNTPTLSDHDNHLYIRDDSGGLLVGCFEPMGKPIAPGRLDADFAFGLLPEDWDHFEPMMELALKRLPALETAEVKMLLNGPESFTPDGQFMLGETPGTRGLYIGGGMNSVGLACGGGAGMNLAQLIVEGHTAYDLSDTDPARFAPVFNSVEHLMARAPEILGGHYDIAFPGKQLRTARRLRALPADAHHRAAGAHFGQFYGWERPLYYGAEREPVLRFGRPDWFEQVRAEVEAAHTGAALFDASCFGKIDVRGPDAEAFLRHACAGQLQRAPGAVIYTAVLNARGTYASDLTALRLADNHYRLLTGTAAIARDMATFTARSDGFDVSLQDVTEAHALIGLMGPQAAAVADQLGGEWMRAIGYFRHATGELAGVTVRAARLSYVGEAGWEISCASADAADLFAALRDAGAVPAGLYAQTSMRIEKGFCAMGHELDSDISPADVGMAGLCRGAGGFVGCEALQARIATGEPAKLCTLVFRDRAAVPIGHEPVLLGEQCVGQTSSCAYGHRIDAPIALAHLDRTVDAGAALSVVIAGTHFAADRIDGAAFDPAGSRMRVGG